MNCPSCHAGMEVLAVTNHLGSRVDVDLCWPCHLIWFDHLESSSLSPDSVVELFRAINAHSGEPRNLVAMKPGCPTCSATLNPTHDLSRSGRFSYFRCPVGHGRLIAFVQFLREKQFIRTLAAPEIKALSAKVSQVRCSSCGASVDLTRDSACTHCGSAIAVLDRDAVIKALAEYDRSRLPRPGPAPQARALPRPQKEGSFTTPQPANEIAVADLVVSGLAALLSVTLD